MKGKHTVNIPGELASAASNGVVASADGVYDYNQGKFQEDINAETSGRLSGQDQKITEKLAEIDQKYDNFEDKTDEYFKQESANNNKKIEEGLKNVSSVANNDVEVVDVLPDTGVANKTYRVIGEHSYADYAYFNGEWKKLAEYDRGVDDEPTAGSENLVTSGGVVTCINEITSLNKNISDTFTLNIRELKGFDATPNRKPINVKQGNVVTLITDEDFKQIIESTRNVIAWYSDGTNSYDDNIDDIQPLNSSNDYKVKIFAKKDITYIGFGANTDKIKSTGTISWHFETESIINDINSNIDSTINSSLILSSFNFKDKTSIGDNAGTSYGNSETVACLDFISVKDYNINGSIHFINDALQFMGAGVTILFYKYAEASEQSFISQDYYQKQKTIINIPTDANYFRIAFGTKGSTGLVKDANLDNISIKFKSVKGEIQDIKHSLSELKKETNVANSDIVKLSLLDFRNKHSIGTPNGIHYNSASTVALLEYIPIEHYNNNGVLVFANNVSEFNGVGLAVAFYREPKADENSYIDRDGYQFRSNKIVIPSGAKYFRLALGTKGDTGLLEDANLDNIYLATTSAASHINIINNYLKEPLILSSLPFQNNRSVGDGNGDDLGITYHNSITVACDEFIPIADYNIDGKLQFGNTIKEFNGVGLAVYFYRENKAGKASAIYRDGYQTQYNTIIIPEGANYIRLALGTKDNTGLIKDANLDNIFILRNTHSLEADTRVLKSEVREIKTDITELQSRVSDSVYSLNPDVHTALASAKFIPYNYPRDGYNSYIAFLVTTDIHDDWAHFRRAIQYANDEELIDTVLVLGDVGNTPSGLRNYNFEEDALKCRVPVLTVPGNHEVATNEPHIPFSNEEFINKFYTPNLISHNGEVHEQNSVWWYKDYSREINQNPYDKTTKHLRVIGLNQGDYSSELGYNEWIFSQEQIDWLVKILDSTPSDYSVLILTHSTMEDKSNLESVNSKFDCGFSITYNEHTNKSFITDIIRAWIKGENVNVESSNNIDSSVIRVNHTFTEERSNKFVGFLSGHSHRDCLNRIKGDEAIYQFNINCTCSYQYQQYGDIGRTEKGKANDCLTVFVYDFIKHSVKLIRVGADITNDMKKRDFDEIILK